MAKIGPLPEGRGKGEGDIRWARKLRRNQTGVEKKLWDFLRDRQLLRFKFRRQHPLGKFVADFCCLEKRLVIELDGGQHSWQGSHDSVRTREMEKDGFQVVRFWNNELMENPQGVLERIVSLLKSPHLDPLPIGERKYL